MAANKPFANFDKLSKLARPSVLTPSNTPSQGSQKINPGFAQQISLADRLKQSSLGTTKHLAQYFVTDVFTNIIKIKKPIDIPKDSLVTIGLPAETRQQGGELPRAISFLPIHGESDPRAVRYDLAEKQGVVRFPDAYDVSNITIVYPSNQTDKSLAQGTYYLNGQYFSTTQTEVPPTILEQGTVEIKKVITVREQGGTDPEKAISIASIERAQSIVTLNGKARSQTSTMIPVPEVLQGDGVTPTLAAGENAFINEQSVDLRTVGYLSLGFGLRFLPVVVQGGQSPRYALSEANNATTQHSEGGLNPTNQANTPEVGFVIRDTRRAMISALLTNPFQVSELTPYDAVTPTQQPGTSDPRLGSNLDQYGKIGPNNNNDNLTFQNTEVYNSQARAQLAISILNPIQGIGGDQAATLIKLVMDDPSNGRAGDKSVDDYEKYFKSANQSPNNTVASVEVGGIENQPNPNIPITNALGNTANDSSTGINSLIKSKVDFKQHRKGFNGSYKYYGDVTKYEQIIQAVNRSPRANAKRPNSTISIAPVEGGDLIIFDAFIKNLSDSLSVAYGDYKHIGQMDTFKVYQGTTRQLALSFDVVAMPGSTDFTNSTSDSAGTLAKINRLMNVCGVGAVSGQYIKGPIIRIQIAGLVTGLICACSSVKVDVPIADATWDLDTEKPQLYNISLDLAVLAMEDDKLLVRGGNFYIP
jgi:hypothetical protein